MRRYLIVIAILFICIPAAWSAVPAGHEHPVATAAHGPVRTGSNAVGGDPTGDDPLDIVSVTTAQQGEYVVVTVTFADPVPDQEDMWLGFDFDVDSDSDTSEGESENYYGLRGCEADLGPEYTMHYPYEGEGCFHFLGEGGYDPVEAQESGNQIAFYVPATYFDEYPQSPTVLVNAEYQGSHTDCALVAGPLGAMAASDVPALDRKGLAILLMVLAAAAVVALRR